jgi:hypothetical protein
MMTKISYGGYRFPPEIIQQAIWRYIRFTLSFRDVENLLAERGILVSYESVCRWVNHFGPMIAADLLAAAGHPPAKRSSCRYSQTRFRPQIDASVSWIRRHVRCQIARVSRTRGRAPADRDGW